MPRGFDGADDHLSCLQHLQIHFETPRSYTDGHINICESKDHFPLIFSPSKNLIMSTSADTRPISPTRFSAALQDLSINMLHLKVLEIRNSIAHLQYSNDQLRPFAEGSSTAVSEPTTTVSDSTATGEPDQDCIDAIRENEQVIDRMAARITLIRTEVEQRGVSWTEFQSMEEVLAKKEEQKQVNGETNGAEAPAAEERSHPAWSDGTFQMGTIRNGEVHMDAQAGQPEGGRLNDEQLQRALEERMRELGNEDDEGGMHL